MKTSFQNEIPKARVNITLDLETNGAQKKTELPLKLLILGKFNPDAEKLNIASREKINITKENLNHTLENLSLTTHYTVPNHLKKNNSELQVRLNFKRYADFHPKQIVTQIPELRQLVAMRNLLKELKANIVDNKTLQKELEKIIHDKKAMQQIQHEFKKLSTDHPNNNED